MKKYIYGLNGKEYEGFPTEEKLKITVLADNEKEALRLAKSLTENHQYKHSFYDLKEIIMLEADNEKE